MSPARGPRPRPLEGRLVFVDPATARFEHLAVRDLPALVRPGDLLVVNDSATLPASLQGHRARGREPLEVRLAGELPGGGFRAVLFGPGDFRQRTEERAPPPRVERGEAIVFGPGLAARVEHVSALSPRLVTLVFDRGGAELYAAIYKVGHPVQYAHVPERLELWDVQTSYASRPWSVEPPSAGRPLTFGLLAELRRRGVGLARLTHAAGLSSTGDPALDAALPLPERFALPAETVAAVGRARAAGGKVVAVGTTVVRALEGCAADNQGRLVAGEGVTDLRLGPGSPLRIVGALLSGMHEPEASHYELLQAFAPRPLLARAYEDAERVGYLGHEFGDSTFVLAA